MRSSQRWRCSSEWSIGRHGAAPTLVRCERCLRLMLIEGLEDLDLTAPLAHLAEHGYARLGRVLDDAGLLALRERAEDLMLGRVTYPGPFFQLDAVRGKYEDAPLGLGWL